jgi:hypothetical protein
MDIAVPFLSEKEIETSAMLLLVDFGGLGNGGNIKPPVPVEKILEKHLKLTLDFHDLHERLRMPRSGEEPDVLGALWAESGDMSCTATPTSWATMKTPVRLMARACTALLNRRCCLASRRDGRNSQAGL